MPILRVRQGGVCCKIPFQGTPLLCDVLLAAGLALPRPCGGRGVCGKCAAALTGDVSPANDAEKRAGARLSCQAVLLGDCETVLPEPRPMEQIAVDGPQPEERCEADEDAPFGAAVDIGTTTLALRLLSLTNGGTLAVSAARNPQTSVAADVMGRIGAARDGLREPMRRMVQDALEALLRDACTSAKVTRALLRRMVVVGNTAMLTLLTGRNPAALACAPFAADCLFGLEEPMLGVPAYYPSCAHAFVGADLLCAVLASRMCESSETALLCDIGTNGELALWKNGTLYVASTAAGPAFEGAGIAMGCGSVRGAIDRVWAEGGVLGAHTLGDAPATGLCGSGLIDAVAALLVQERIDETGATEECSFHVRDGVCLYPGDIRGVQLAKAAIRAGIDVLLACAGVQAQAVRRLYIAGGFGSRLHLPSAAAIGLIPKEWANRAVVLGNAALAGAALLVRDPALAETTRALATDARHVALGGDARFEEAYFRHMGFPHP